MDNIILWIMAIAMVVIIAVLFKVEDWFGKDVEG